MGSSRSDLVRWKRAFPLARPAPPLPEVPWPSVWITAPISVIHGWLYAWLDAQYGSREIRRGATGGGWLGVAWRDLARFDKTALGSNNSHHFDGMRRWSIRIYGHSPRWIGLWGETPRVTRTLPSAVTVIMPGYRNRAPFLPAYSSLWRRLLARRLSAPFTVRGRARVASHPQPPSSAASAPPMRRIESPISIYSRHPNVRVTHLSYEEASMTSFPTSFWDDPTDGPCSSFCRPKPSSSLIWTYVFPLANTYSLRPRHP